MRITNVGYNHFHGADFIVDRPEGSGDYFLIMLRTPALFTLGGKEQRAEEGSAVLYNKGTPLNYRAAGAQLGYDWIQFLPDNSEDEAFITALSIQFDTLYKLGSITALSLLVNMMCQENYSNNFFKADTTDLLKVYFILYDS